mmetsp:Transcript_38595/g.34298  ORF Transcript_38595/g.34298 Transcript_38595/m.34298 type:complete len:271 (+) Transcript_38595:77-889(+)
MQINYYFSQFRFLGLDTSVSDSHQTTLNIKGVNTIFLKNGVADIRSGATSAMDKDGFVLGDFIDSLSQFVHRDQVGTFKDTIFPFTSVSDINKPGLFGQFLLKIGCFNSVILLNLLSRFDIGLKASIKVSNEVVIADSGKSNNSFLFSSVGSNDDNLFFRRNYTTNLGSVRSVKGNADRSWDEALLAFTSGSTIDQSCALSDFLFEVFKAQNFHMLKDILKQFILLLVVSSIMEEVLGRISKSSGQDLDELFSLHLLKGIIGLLLISKSV